MYVHTENALGKNYEELKNNIFSHEHMMKFSERKVFCNQVMLHIVKDFLLDLRIFDWNYLLL